jgi:hypothetical protein
MSSSREHSALMEKLNLLTGSEKKLFVLLCHQYWHGEEDTILMIGQLVNDNCPIDLWPNGQTAEQNKINGSLERSAVV